jgi:hypothetical protein
MIYFLSFGLKTNSTLEKLSQRAVEIKKRQ